MVTYAELARLTAASYTTAERRGRWSLRARFGGALRGFGACLYEREDRAEAVLCVRGTDDLVDCLDDLRLLFGRAPRQWVRGRAAVRRARELIEPDARLVLAGHSLGGAYASALGAQLGLATVTFNAPGMVAALARVGDAGWVRARQPIVLNLCISEDWIWRLSGAGLGRRHLLDVGAGAPPARWRGPLGVVRAFRHGRAQHGGVTSFVAHSLRLHAMSAFRPLVERGAGFAWDAPVGERPGASTAAARRAARAADRRTAAA